MTARNKKPLMNASSAFLSRLVFCHSPLGYEASATSECLQFILLCLPVLMHLPFLRLNSPHSLIYHTRVPVHSSTPNFLLQPPYFRKIVNESVCVVTPLCTHFYRGSYVLRWSGNIHVLSLKMNYLCSAERAGVV